MRREIFVVALLVSSPALAANDEQSSPPSEQQSASPSPYAELNKQVQEKLRAESFYDGPINGDFGFYTQAALAQFQLSRALPASGSLDETTLAALGLESQGSNERRCDDLMGQEKEHCLQQGGTMEASAQSGSGASAPAR
jgi:hypothetical protein